MDRRLRARRLCLALAGVLLWPAAATAAKDVYSKGDPVVISGRVTDAGGKALGKVTVLFELSHTGFELRRFKTVKSNTLQIPVVADADGRYRHEWRWDGYYNTFELAVAMPARKGGRSGFEVLYRFEISQPVSQGSPIEMPLVVEGALGWLHRLLDGSASSEEARVFRDMGRPERYDEGDDGTAAWWYFEAGKVFRFRAGVLEEVVEFAPVKPL